jgi:hypothetical protein
MAEQERVDRQKEAVKARRRARLAAEALARAVPPAPEIRSAAETGEDAVRRPWETSPGLRLARNAAVRTVRPLLRRSAERAATPA